METTTKERNDAAIAEDVARYTRRRQMTREEQRDENRRNRAASMPDGKAVLRESKLAD